MQEKLLRNTAGFIARNNLLSRNNQPVIVGLSGGPDSVALLSVLIKLGYRCIAAHVNFHLRGAESNNDEMFVRSLADKLQIPLHTIDFKTNEYAKNEGISIEMAARTLRYDWFGNLAQITDAQAIAVGHHLDDNLETMLLNLIRGTGLRGLTGMPVRNGKIVRPFLGTSRSDIRDYLDSEKINFVTDSSNTSSEIVRNKIRHEVLPLLESINPAFREKLTETRNYLSQSDRLIASVIDSWKSNANTYSVHNNEIKLDIDHILAFREPELLLFELLSPMGFNSSQIADTVSMLKNIAGKRVISETHILLKDRKHLIIRPKTDDTYAEIHYIESDQNTDNPLNLKISTFNHYAGFIYSTQKHKVHLDAGKIAFPLLLRKVKPGDYFYPLGMKMQKKKLSDYLTETKLSRFEKDDIRVLESDGKIVWVVGHRIDERFCISTETTKVAELVIRL